MRAFGKQRESRFFSWLELENLKNEHYLTLLPYVVRKLKYECFLKLSRCNIRIFCTLTEKNLSEKLLNWKNIRKKQIATADDSKNSRHFHCIRSQSLYRFNETYFASNTIQFCSFYEKNFRDTYEKCVLYGWW